MKEDSGEKDAVLSIDIPSDIFRDRSLSVLEVLVEHLKDKGMSFHEIAELINRDDRTIWTVYNRARKKRNEDEK